MRRSRHDDTEMAIANFGLTFAKALLVFCIIMFVMISVPTPPAEDGIKPNAHYIIRMSWALDTGSDIDIWIRDPDGLIVYFGNQQAGDLSLERDDLGNPRSDGALGSSAIEEAEEVVAVRGFKPGEYIVNAHLYRYRQTGGDPSRPLEVSLRIDAINPSVRTIYRATRIFRFEREEVHFLRFRMDADGNITDISEDLPTNIRELR